MRTYADRLNVQPTLQIGDEDGMQAEEIGHFDILQVIRSKIFRRANGERQSRVISSSV